MSHRPVIQISVHILLLNILCALPAAAQRSDLLLSHDPILLFLPDDMRIQDAARLDSTTLVAWGSTEAVSTHDFRNVLYMQPIRGRMPIGDPVILHSPDARPTAFVFVRVNGANFRVIWNDQRAGAPGIYMREFNRDGRAVGNEERVAAGEISSSESLDPLPGLSILRVKGHAPFLLKENGELIELTPLPDLLTVPWIVSADSGLAFLKGDSIVIYDSFLDSEPSVRLRYVREDSTIAGTETLFRDNRGDYGITFVTRGEPSEWRFYPAQLMLRLVEAKVSLNDGLMYDRAEVDSLFIAAGSDGTIIANIYLDDIKRQRICDGRYHVRIAYGTETKTLGQPIYTVNETWNYEVDNDRLRIIAENEFGRGICSNGGTVRVLRAVDSIASVVDLYPDSTSAIRLSAPAARLEAPLRHVRPGLAMDAGSLLVTWYNSGQTVPTVLSQWHYDTGRDDSLRFIGSVAIPANSTDPSGAGGTFGGIYDRYAAGGYGIISSKRKLWDLSSPSGWTILWTSQYLFPFSDGWRQLFAEEGGFYEGSSGNQSEHSPISLSFDPDSGSTLIVSTSGRATRYFHQIDPAGKVLSEGTYQTKGGTVLSLGGGDFAEVGDDGMARLYYQGVIVDSLLLNNWDVRASLTRLFNGMILRCGQNRRGDGLECYLYDNRFRLLAQTELPLRDSLTGIAVAQSPVDSTITLVLTTSGGTYLTALERNLEPLPATAGLLLHYQQISSVGARAEAPFALFSHDTLFAVWEDYRSGFPDIRGTWLRPVDYVSGIWEEDSPDAEENSSDQLRLMPNPATDHITVEWRRNAADSAEILLVDPLGNVVLKMSLGNRKAGELRHEIDLSNVLSGAYLLICRAAGEEIVRKVLIAARGK